MNDRFDKTCIIKKVFFRNESSFFSVGLMTDVETGESCKFSGNFLAEIGQQLKIHGKWQNHPRYGEQVKIERFEIDLPINTEGLVKFLANRKDFVGIGPAKARKIVDALGDDFEEKIADPELVMKIGNVSRETAENLKSVWESSKAYNSVSTLLASYGLTDLQIKKLVEHFGCSIAQILERNPYVLIGQVERLGFKKVDTIALKSGFEKEHPKRLEAGVTYCLSEIQKNGDCWMPKDELSEAASDALFLDSLDAQDKIQETIKSMEEREILIAEFLNGQTCYAEASIHRQESFIFNTIMNHKYKRSENADLWEANKEKIDSETSTLTNGQLLAINNAFTYKFSLISGGAGTGKTYMIKKIDDICEILGIMPVYAAPTGKAARRIEEAIGKKGIASTIHSLLGVDKRKGGFLRGPKNPIEASLVIIDEVSMLYSSLGYSLLKAINFSCTSVVFIGDHNQLPPIGAGNILRDLVKYCTVPICVLSECMRQAGQLRENSALLLKGQVGKTSETEENNLSSWYLKDDSKLDDQIYTQKFIERIYNFSLEEKLGHNVITDVQLLTPMHKGLLGTKAMNKLLQVIIQKKKFDRDVMPTEENRSPVFYPGDKVIQTKNDYGMNVMNGTIGFIEETKDNGDIIIKFDDTAFELKKGGEQLRHIELAYALTFHKVQGSEFPCAIVIVHKAHAYMHHRNLFYTGVTRASERVIIVGDKWGIKNCASKVQVDKRKTFINEWLREEQNRFPELPITSNRMEFAF